MQKLCGPLTVWDHAQENDGEDVFNTHEIVKEI